MARLCAARAALFLVAVLLVAVAAARFAAAARACTSADYAARYSACALGKRSLWFERAADCSGGAPAPPPVDGVSCECTALDYAARFADCVDGRTAVSFEKVSDCSGGAAAPPLVTDAQCFCARPMYTQCDHRSGTRSLVYYAVAEGRCAGNLTALPAGVAGIPCSLQCAAGSYLPLGATACRQCAAGSYSIGSGKRFVTWPALPEGMRTYCTARSPACAPWTLNSTFVTSGANAGAVDLKSTLEYVVDLVHDGQVRFTYQVDAEQYFDGLTFFIDDKPWSLGLVSYKFRYTEFTAPLASGYHVLRWVFSKDNTESVGKDMAMLQMVEVTGTSFNEFECLTCGPGFTSGAGATDCAPCSAGSYSAVSGGSACLDCAASQYSSPGAAACTARPACTANDFTALYTACDADGRRTLQYRYTEPVTCDTANFALPPDVPGLACPPCAPGQYKHDEHYHCVFCEDGSFSAAEDVPACTKCAGGSAAVRQLTLAGFSELPANASTACDGNCGTNGWQVVNSRLLSGFGHGRSVVSWLELPIDLYVDGDVAFNYSLQSPAMGSSLEFAVDSETILRTVITVSDRVVRTPVAAGKHTVRWSFARYSNTEGGSRSFAALSEITVRGSRTGGAVSCTDCAAGSYAAAGSDRCTQCPPGRYSAAKATTCAFCAPNQFSLGAGATSCRDCGSGTYSAAGASACQTDCMVASPSLTYDLSKLARTSAMYGPIRDNNSQVYFLNVCERSQANHTCTLADGTALNMYACQHTTADFSVDIGSVLSLVPIDWRGSGVVVRYTDGTPGCTPRHPRTTNITILCDADAGVGEPLPPPAGPVESPPGSCNYQFVWRSLYGCPLCTTEHMERVESGCEGGTTTTTYFWTSPKRCHSGAALPPPQRQSCSSLAISLGVIFVIAGASAAVLALLITLIVCLVVRHRRLYSQYSRLQSQHEELDFMPNQQPAPTHLMDTDSDEELGGTLRDERSGTAARRR